MIIHKFTLPFPPSVNSLFGGGSKQKRFPSKKYKEWLRSCPELESLRLSNEVAIEYTFAFPDKRVRDGQNYLKAVTDYLTKQGVIQDDNWKIVVSEIWNHMGVDRENPRVEVTVVELQ